MKKALSLLLACLLLFSVTSGFAASKSKLRYTLETEGKIVLQDTEDRNITPLDDLAPNPVIDGESPTTGLPLSADYYQPMIVQISNPSETVVYNGKKHTFAGLGSRAPWGGQYADIMFEGILYQSGETRLSLLFNDSFALNEPISVGPVRSARIGHVLLMQEWDSGLVFGGGPAKEGNDIMLMVTENGTLDAGLAFNVVDTNDWNDYTQRVKGVRSPENLDVNLVELRKTIPETTVAAQRPFLFSDVSPYTEGYDFAYSIGVDWGHKRYISSFYYDEQENLYLRYSGTAPYLTYNSASDRSEENQEQLSFSNVIIQRVPYKYVMNSSIMPDMQAVGKGNADIFIGGRYIPGYWIREDVESPTVFLDDKGNELVLTRGKTFICHLPPENLLTYSNEIAN